MTNLENGVLLSWVDLRTDPYVSRGRDEGVPGPTLTLLFDPESPYRGDIAHAVLFYRNLNTVHAATKTLPPPTLPERKLNVAATTDASG